MLRFLEGQSLISHSCLHLASSSRSSRRGLYGYMSNHLWIEVVVVDEFDFW